MTDMSSTSDASSLTDASDASTRADAESLPDADANPDAATMDGAVVSETCDWAIELSAVTTPDADGAIHYTVSNAGATEHSVGVCDSDSWSTEGTDVAFAYTPEHEGILEIDFAGSTIPLDFYVRTDCNDADTEVLCHNGYADVAYRYQAYVHAGETVFIIASAYEEGLVGDIAVHIRPEWVLTAGASCDPTVSSSPHCAPGLECGGSAGSETCTIAPDRGCGVGRAATDLTPLIEDAHATFHGTTRYGLNTMIGRGATVTAPPHSGYMGGPWIGPEALHYIDVPFDADVAVSIVTDGTWYADLDVRGECDPETMASDLAHSRDFSPSGSVSVDAIRSRSSGERIYIIVDAGDNREGRISGNYTLNVEFVPNVHEGETCTLETTGAHCASDLSCRDVAFATQCVSSVCGDAVTDGSETCEDGNSVLGDGCGNDCRLEDQGDGAATCADADTLKFSRVSSTEWAAVAYGATFDAEPEHFYTFTLAAARRVHMQLHISGGYYASLHVARGCGGEPDLIDGRPTSSGVPPDFTVELDAGTYYLRVFGAPPTWYAAYLSTGMHMVELRATSL